jgi:hypothetical protein
MTTTQSIQIHGRTYTSRIEVSRRANELAALNAELGESDGRATELNMLLAHLDATRPAAQAADPKPFYVLTRIARADGTVRKSGRNFATRAAQARYITNAPASVAITAYN